MPQAYGQDNEVLSDQIMNLIALCGGSPDADLIKEMIHTALRTVQDRTQRGDLKIMNRALRELRYAFKVFSAYRHRRKVSLFGSSRMKPHDPVYSQAERFARAITREGFMVITGAGEGIMEAGHRGAGRQNSFGLNIKLPFEQEANEVIQQDEKLIVFHYFFTRKLFFLKEADALALFPGGFGTNDEAFESLTLMQTGKSDILPIVLLDVPGGTYWQGWLDFVKREMLAREMISPEDLSLVTLTDDAKQAVRVITRFYRVYHSSRYVRDRLVLRLNRPLPEKDLRRLNREFEDILVSGRIEAGTALPEEANEPEIFHLPRLVLHFDRKHFGRLRQLIDAINESG